MRPLASDHPFDESKAVGLKTPMEGTPSRM